MKRSSVYWLLPAVDDHHHRRASILDDIGYHVFFFENFETLIKEICVKRAQILILGDEWPSAEAIGYAHAFANIPDINGARLLVSNSRNDFALMDAAMNEGFRDIIPADLDDHEWLQRFEFATSGVESVLSLHSDLEFVAEPIDIVVPARLVWIGAQQVWLETRSCPRVGDTLKMEGGFASALGLSTVNVQVQQKQQTNLTYRFSEAIIASWYQDAVINAEPQKIIDTLDTLHRVDLGQRPKIFLAIQSPALRTTLLKYLDKRKYEVHTALQKQSLIYEPKFFSPDLVFVEERLTQGESKRNFYELLRYLPEHACIVTIGGKESPTAKNSNAPRRTWTLKHVPVNLSELIEREYLVGLAQRRPTSNDKQASFPPADHAYSFAQLHMTAELVKADYLQFNLRTTTRIGPYSLIKITSPHFQEKLGGPLYVKVIESPDVIGPGPYLCNAHICNLTQALRQPLAGSSDQVAGES
ncbi:hypothetical protein [Oligoflexus tunisiensis]|uniref:hypothetical protein n=1 Tax=Oligoflexus tunisiensis TaxID=708132 RepID=UPI00114CC545|nr:hypothetical protein [Oligoflexus tunisiensis]